MLSGIQPLTPSEGSSGLGNEIVMVNGDGSNSDVFASEVRYSMPKKGEVIDLTQLPVCSISPIICREENNSVFIHDQIMTNNEDELNQSPQIHGTAKRFGWQSLYNKFQSCKTYKALEKVVLTECNNVPPLPDFFIGEINITYDVIDRVSQNYIPRDSLTPAKFKCKYVPLMIEPDGNCLLRSLSRLTYGIESRHMEIRCRIVMDSMINIRNYTDHDYLVRGASHTHQHCSHIGELYCDYSGVPNSPDANFTLSFIQSVFKKDIMRIRKENEWCDMWQIHSAANVLNCKIVMLFPTKNIRDDVRLDMHRAFWPESLNFVHEFGLLWTSLNENAMRYNHIVPLVKRYSSNLQ